MLALQYIFPKNKYSTFSHITTIQWAYSETLTLTQHYYLIYNPYAKLTNSSNNVICRWFTPNNPTPFDPGWNQGSHIAFIFQASLSSFNLEQFPSLFGLFCSVLVFPDIDIFKELRPVLQNIFQLAKILPERVIPSTLHWGHMIFLCPINDDDNFDHPVKVALARFPHY